MGTCASTGTVGKDININAQKLEQPKQTDKQTVVPGVVDKEDAGDQRLVQKRELADAETGQVIIKGVEDLQQLALEAKEVEEVRLAEVETQRLSEIAEDIRLANEVEEKILAEKQRLVDEQRLEVSNFISNILSTIDKQAEEEATRLAKIAEDLRLAEKEILRAATEAEDLRLAEEEALRLAGESEINCLAEEEEARQIKEACLQRMFEEEAIRIAKEAEALRLAEEAQKAADISSSRVQELTAKLVSLRANAKVARDRAHLILEATKHEPKSTQFGLLKQAGTSALPTFFSRFQERHIVLYRGTLRYYEKAKLDENGAKLFPYGTNLKGWLELRNYHCMVDIHSEDGTLALDATDIILHYDPANPSKTSVNDILEGKGEKDLFLRVPLVEKKMKAVNEIRNHIKWAREFHVEVAEDDRHLFNEIEESCAGKNIKRSFIGVPILGYGSHPPRFAVCQDHIPENTDPIDETKIAAEIEETVNQEKIARAINVAAQAAVLLPKETMVDVFEKRNKATNTVAKR